MRVAQSFDRDVLPDPVVLVGGRAREERALADRVDLLALLGVAEVLCLVPDVAGVIVERGRAPVERPLGPDALTRMTTVGSSGKSMPS